MNVGLPFRPPGGEPTPSLLTRDGRPMLRIERRLAHPPEKVWRAVTEPEHLSQWYPARVVEMEPRVGGKIVFDYGQGAVSSAVVTELDPPRVFAFTERAPEQMTRETECLLRFELRPDGVGCLLLFTQTFADRPAAASYAAGWQTCLDVLEAALSGGPARHGSVSAERHQGYVEALGLDAGSAEVTPDGWRVRFERQLMHQPVDAVWSVLTGPDVPVVGGPVPPACTTGEVPAGAVTAVEAPRLLEYAWQAGGHPAGRVRWELTSGPGGARILLTQTGPGELAGQRATALAAWRTHIEALAARLRDAQPPPAPQDG